ncbi:hypothetical protein D9M71_555040 [compost metagenome]
MDQPPLLGLFGVQALTRQAQGQGASIAKPALQKPGGTAVRHHAQGLDKGQVEKGRAGRQDNVASQGQAHAGACGGTIEGHDHGHRQGVERGDQRVEQAAHALRGLLATGATVCRECGAMQVGATAKHTARGVDQQGAYGLVGAHLVEHIE